MSTVTSHDGTTIAFDRLGDGPPVVLVSGGPNDRSANAPLAELLAPHFTVVNYDRRGRGGSGDTPPYAVDREVEDLDALIDHAGGSAFVYGTSSGAAFALIAAARGLPVTGLALWEPPFIVDDSRPRVPSDYKAQLQEMISAGRRGDAMPKLVASTTLGTAEWKNSTLIRGDVAQELAKLKQRPGGSIAVSGSATLVRSLLRERLLDELRLLVHPIVLGKGRRLFEGGDEVPLKLLDSKAFSTGVVSLVYGPADD